MKVGIIGTGYVGLPTGVGLAELGHDIICIDKDERKINALQNGQITLYEEGLEELLRKNFQTGKIKFTTSMQQGIKDADVVLIAVGTPPCHQSRGYAIYLRRGGRTFTLFNWIYGCGSQINRSGRNRR